MNNKDKLKELYTASGLTRPMFAEKLGVSWHTLKKYFFGMIKVSDKRIERAQEIVKNMGKV